MKLSNTFALICTAGAVLLACPVAHASEDGKIESSAKESYNFRTYLKGDHIRVNSKDGVVTLKGSVADESHKAVAADTVANLPGVVSVDNELKVRGAPMAEHSDGWIAFKVKSALLFHRNVSATTKVDVHGGVVTLTGNVKDPAEKDLTSEYARDVEGVTAVNNQMTVSVNNHDEVVANAPVRDNGPATINEPAGNRAPIVQGNNQSVNNGETAGQKIDDASITAQVKASLLSHRSTSAVDTKVKTKDGVVTIMGRARSQAEKDLVTRLATDINGVVSVNNEMTATAPIVQ